MKAKTIYECCYKCEDNAIIIKNGKTYCLNCQKNTKTILIRTLYCKKCKQTKFFKEKKENEWQCPTCKTIRKNDEWFE